jgi:hypothetical protein
VGEFKGLEILSGRHFEIEADRLCELLEEMVEGGLWDKNFLGSFDFWILD